MLPFCPMFTYEEAIDYLYTFVDYSLTRLDQYSAQTFDLRRVTHLLELLGNPHQQMPLLHITGTKGKGSVAAMCTSVLRAAGLRTGFYTSPHLQDYTERIQINGAQIPRATLTALIEEVRRLVPQVPRITTFELTTALAFLYFAREAVDAAVIEVGLGGRLDATNVIVPRIAVITSLSYDHTNLLGNTLAQIAAEKGGIIKPGVPVVSAPQPEAARAVLARLAAEQQAPLIQVGRDWHYRAETHSLENQTFSVWSDSQAPQTFSLPLLGLHQVENAAVAYATLMEFSQRSQPLPREAFHEGFRTVRWPGRFEILRRQPYLVADGAHNRDSAQKLMTAVRDYFPGRRVILIYGASADKDIPGMFTELLAPGTPVTQVLLTQAVHPRASDPDDLYNLARAVAAPAVSLEPAVPVSRALEKALELAGSEDVILACGSLFVVAEIRAAQTELLTAR